MGIFFGKRPDEMEGQQDMLQGLEGIDMQPQRVIDERSISEATKTLQKYKQGKAHLEERLVQDELWYQLRHWEIIRKKRVQMPKSTDKTVIEPTPEPTSAWLFNSIINKHADAMDNFPEPIVLPREKSDVESAKTLSEILPVVMEYNDFQEVYDKNWYEKLKHGTACYGVFWDSTKDNGLGDISIKAIDLLNVFFEPGCTNIQDSRNLFITELVDNDLLEQQHPELKGKLTGRTIDVKEYIYDDTVDTSEKSVVIDWYYKQRDEAGRTLLQYVKYVGDTILYASENDPERAQMGFYEHGKYPIVFDTLYPEKGTPVGFGYVAVCKEPQLYIDKLSANIMQASMMGTKKRFFVSNSTSVNEQEFMDWNKPIVHVEGEISDARIQEITTAGLDGIYYNVLQSKIEEMKDTAANKDVNSGGTGSGVTAASAIAALQEAGNKVSRDMIQASYRSYTDVIKLCIELMRQFYDSVRSFRITGVSPGEYEFVDVSNQGLKEQMTGYDEMGNELYRKPIFDLKIKAQKKSPFSRMEENERAKELYSLGFFEPSRAQEAIGALKMMDFEGIDDVKEYISQGQTLMNMLEQMSMLSNQLAMNAGMAPSVVPEEGEETPAEETGKSGGASTPFTDGIMQAQTPMTSYGQRLAERSTPSVEGM